MRLGLRYGQAQVPILIAHRLKRGIQSEYTATPKRSGQELDHVDEFVVERERLLKKVKIARPDLFLNFLEKMLIFEETRVNAAANSIEMRVEGASGESPRGRKRRCVVEPIHFAYASSSFQVPSGYSSTFDLATRAANEAPLPSLRATGPQRFPIQETHMTRKRIVFSIALGFPSDQFPPLNLDAALQAIDSRLTRIVGGLMRFSGQGTWALGAHTSDYSGTIERNTVIKYSISVMPCVEAHAFSMIRKTIAEVATANDLDVEFVHVSRTETEERIFKISDHFGPKVLS